MKPGKISTLKELQLQVPRILEEYADNQELAFIALANPLVLQPGTSGSVILKITIPPDAREGSYSCLLQAKNLNDLKAMLILKIVNG